MARNSGDARWISMLAGGAESSRTRWQAKFTVRCAVATWLKTLSEEANLLDPLLEGQRSVLGAARAE